MTTAAVLQQKRAKQAGDGDAIMGQTIGDLKTMRLAWMTDVHLNFLEPLGRRQFLESARDQADAFGPAGRQRRRCG